MRADRRAFGVSLTAGLLGLGARRPIHGQSNRSLAPAVSNTAAPVSLAFQNATFRYIFLISLGRAYHLSGNVGKVFYIASQVTDGDYESAFEAFMQAGEEARALAEESLAAGHRESAKQAYLWAQNYYDSATYFVDGSADPARFYSTWKLLYQCWLKATKLFDPPIEHIRIPYENTELQGFFFKASDSDRKRPLLILNNGSDGSLLDMWTTGAAGALARGYNCLTFDGPGQGYALWEQKLYFRPDWEKVITPVIDYAVSRADVDPKRIALQGISQGGYWVLRAAAFEKRIAAAIADPGVVDVSTSWTGVLSKKLLGYLQNGDKDQFDSALAMAPPAVLNNLRFRMRPYGLTSYYDTFKAAMNYNLTNVAGQITCPTLITAPVNEAFWPGQSQRLYDLLSSPKKLVPFTVSDGADLHCEPKGYGLRDLRILNWLDETLPSS